MYFLTTPLSLRFIYMVAYLTIPSCVQNNQDRTHDFSPLQTLNIYFQSSPLPQIKVSRLYPGHPESSLPSNPISKTSTTTFMLSCFTSFHFHNYCPDPNHFSSLHCSIHFSGCTVMSLNSSTAHFLHSSQSDFYNINKSKLLPLVKILCLLTSHLK